jgi:hypothetical protein
LFASGCNVFVTRYVPCWVVLGNGCTHTAECVVLLGLKGLAFQTFQLYANGMVVAVIAPQIVGLACMPSSVIAADKLNQGTITADEKVC